MDGGRNCSITLPSARASSPLPTRASRTPRTRLLPGKDAVAADSSDAAVEAATASCLTSLRAAPRLTALSRLLRAGRRNDGRRGRRQNARSTARAQEAGAKYYNCLLRRRLELLAKFRSHQLYYISTSQTMHRARGSFKGPARYWCDRGAYMRKAREFETERGTLRYWMSENDEETAQLVFPVIQTGRVHGARGLSSALLG